jgi:hypothetical protein
MITNIIKNGSNYLKLYLEEDIIIISNDHILYTNGDLKKEHLKPKCFTKYHGIGTIVIGHHRMYNNVLHLKLKPHSSYNILPENFIACSEHLKIVFVPGENKMTLQNISEDIQYLWLFAFGNYEKISMNDDEEMQLKKGLLLIHDSELVISENTEFNIIKGPCKFYIQTMINVQNIKPDENIITNLLEKVKNKGKIRNTLRNI